MKNVRVIVIVSLVILLMTILMGQVPTDIGSFQTGRYNYEHVLNMSDGTILVNDLKVMNYTRIGGDLYLRGNLQVDGGIDIKDIEGSYTNGEATVCVYNNGTLFARDGGCN